MEVSPFLSFTFMDVVTEGRTLNPRPVVWKQNHPRKEILETPVKDPYLGLLSHLMHDMRRMRGSYVEWGFGWVVYSKQYFSS